jgi:hypothetical protein
MGTEFRVQIGGTTVGDQLNVGNFNYTQFTYTYTATGTSTTIQLGFVEPPNFFYLDDVSFSPTAAPADHGGGLAGSSSLASNIGTANAATLVQSRDRAAVGAFGLGGFGAPSQQPAGAGKQALPPTATSSAGLSLLGNPNPATVGGAAQIDASAYHVVATNALFSDPLLADLFHDVF